MAEKKTQTTPEENTKAPSELDKLKEQVALLVKGLGELQEESAAKDEIIAQLKSAVEDKNKKSLSELPTEVVEREKRMRDKIDITVTRNPLDRGSTDVSYLDPITGDMCKIQRGVKTEVSRAVYEILMNSMQSDEYTTIIAEEKAKEFVEATKALGN